MTQPSPPIRKTDHDALTILLKRQLQNIMLSIPGRVGARMGAGETDVIRILTEEHRRADAEMEALHVAFVLLLRDYTGAHS